MKLINNRVLIMPDDYSLFKLGDMELHQDTSYEVEKHSPQSGKVIKVPDSLNYLVKGLPEIDFDTQLEIKEGDSIVFDYNAVKSAIEDGFSYDKLVAIKYSDIYMAIRDDQGFAVNGYNIVLPKPDKYIGQIFCPTSANKNSLTIGKVVYNSTPLNGYKLWPEYGPDNETVNIGDTILFHRIDSILMQYSQHQKDHKDLYRMQHRDICARIVNDKVYPLNNYVVIRQDEERKLGSGLIRSQRDLEKPSTGTIIRAGAGYKNRKLEMEIGVWCQFDELFASSFIENGFEYRIVHDFNIPCYLKNVA